MVAHYFVGAWCSVHSVFLGRFMFSDIFAVFTAWNKLRVYNIRLMNCLSSQQYWLNELVAPFQRYALYG